MSREKIGLKENEISELADLYCINDVGFAKVLIQT